MAACLTTRSSAASPAIAWADWAMSGASSGRAAAGIARPCLRALRRDWALPAAVCGPVLRCALRWLAVIFWGDGIAKGRWIQEVGPSGHVDDVFGGGAQPARASIATALDLREHLVPAGIGA